MKDNLLFLLLIAIVTGCTKGKDTPAHIPTSSATVSHISIDYPTFAGDSTCMYSNAAGAATYSWDFGDGQTTTLAAPCHTYSIAGNYTVMLTLDGDISRRASGVASVKPAPGFSAEIGGMHTWRHFLEITGDTVTGDTVYHYPDTSFPITYLSTTSVSVLGIHIPCTHSASNAVTFSTDGKPRYEYLSFKRTGTADSLIFFKYRRWDGTKVTVEYFYAP